MRSSVLISGHIWTLNLKHLNNFKCFIGCFIKFTIQIAVSLQRSLKLVHFWDEITSNQCHFDMQDNLSFYIFTINHGCNIAVKKKIKKSTTQMCYQTLTILLLHYPKDTDISLYGLIFRYMMRSKTLWFRYQLNFLFHKRKQSDHFYCMIKTDQLLKCVWH